MQVIEKPLANGEIVFYIEHEIIPMDPGSDNEEATPARYLMIECTTKPQAIALARLLQATNDIYTEERSNCE